MSDCYVDYCTPDEYFKREPCFVESYSEKEARFQILKEKLESYKFDYDPNNIIYKDCNVEQLMYITYIKYGLKRKWMDGECGNKSI